MSCLSNLWLGCQSRGMATNHKPRTCFAQPGASSRAYCYAACSSAGDGGEQARHGGQSERVHLRLRRCARRCKEHEWVTALPSTY